MSRLTEILLSVFPEDEHRLEDLSFWIRDQAPKADDLTDGSPGNLFPLTGALGSEAWGGSKWPTATIWAGVTNYLNVDAFVDHVAGPTGTNRTGSSLFCAMTATLGSGST